MWLSGSPMKVILFHISKFCQGQSTCPFDLNLSSPLDRWWNPSLVYYYRWTSRQDSKNSVWPIRLVWAWMQTCVSLEDVEFRGVEWEKDNRCYLLGVRFDQIYAKRKHLSDFNWCTFHSVSQSIHIAFCPSWGWPQFCYGSLHLLKTKVSLCRLHCPCHE